MKVTLKTVTGAQFEMALDNSLKVSEVKAKVQEQQGDAFPADKMMLIFQGTILKDDTTLAENSVTENGFMVVMITKDKKAAPTPAAPAAAPATEPAAAPAAAAAPAPAAPAAAAAAVAAAAPEAAATGPADYSSAASTLATGQELENSINAICEMGFEREQVQRAMRAAFNNPDRAVEFLMTGIPDMPVEEAPAAAGNEAAAAAAVAAAAVEGGPGGPNSQPLDMFPQGMPGMGGGEGGAGSLDFLRQNPQFQALRQMVQANPQILQPMLQELGKQNPQLLQLINGNQQEFLSLINEAGPEGGIPGMEGAPAPPTITITPEDQAAIERLQSMGFDRAVCIEAYFACDKNEEHAANFLLENPDMLADD